MVHAQAAFYFNCSSFKSQQITYPPYSTTMPAGLNNIWGPHDYRRTEPDKPNQPTLLTASLVLLKDILSNNDRFEWQHC